jgi:hypothetical protein
MNTKRPIVRLQAVLRRLSRDRWLHPKECYALTWHIAKKLVTVSAAGNLLRNCNNDCFHVGMIKGEPTFNRYRNELQYLELLRALGKNKKFSELDLLLLLTRSIKNGN